MGKETRNKILRILIPVLVAGIILIIIYIVLQPENPKNKFRVSTEKICLTKKDCAPVNCGCGCTSDDVINKRHRDKWYKKNNCEVGIACLESLCSVEEVACKYFMCSLEKEDN